MILPTNRKDLLRKLLDVREACHSSSGQRAALAKLQNLWIQSGKASGDKALVNLLYAHVDRLASHLFSPSELRFVIDFEAHYAREVLAKGEVAGRVLTREWQRKDIDMTFGAGVNTSLQYGAAILKQMWGHTGLDSRLIMPWQFGVYREDVNNIEDQEALSEQGYMTLEEAWRRISHLPDAESMFRQIRAAASREQSDSSASSFFHNVLSTSVLNTSGIDAARQSPGGIVQLSGESSLGGTPPVIGLDLCKYNEIWVKDDDREDYTCCLVIEPDIVVSPYFKRENMFAPKRQPYSLIQANYTPGYFWGRSEIADLTEMQGLLATTMEDAKRLMGLQFDKLLAFIGGDGVDDEKYAQFRSGGYVALDNGSSVTDLTPSFPPETFAFINLIKQMMDDVSGFSNILSGQGEPGVRAGNHADMLMKTASPRLRDRSLLVERQCASAADKSLALLRVKEDDRYHTNPALGPEQEFLLESLPGDARVTVDSHSTSPIFADNHRDLIAMGVKAGFIGGDSAIEMLPFPQQDLLLQRYKTMQEQKAKLLQEHPELLHKKGHH